MRNGCDNSNVTLASLLSLMQIPTMKVRLCVAYTYEGLPAWGAQFGVSTEFKTGEMPSSSRHSSKPTLNLGPVRQGSYLDPSLGGKP